jgi:hypothetical protein
MRHSANKAEYNFRRRQIQNASAVIKRQAAELKALDVDKTDLQPVTGTVQWTTSGAGALVETSRRFFEDKIGESTASGLTQNRALGTYHGGQVSTGQMWLLWSLGFTVVSTGFTAAQIAAAAQAISVSVNLRTKDNGVEIGGLLDWPDVLGAGSGISTGNGQIGRRTFSYPIVLDPLDSFTIDLFRRTAVTGLPLSSDFTVHAYMRATRIYDERVLALS